MKVSFEGLGEKVATFWNAPDNAAVAGKVVKIPEACTVKLCADGDKVAGVCVDADLCMATVKLTLPAQFAAFAGDRVSLTAPAVGLSGDYRVYESRCWADENGAGTALTLEERGTGHVAE